MANKLQLTLAIVKPHAVKNPIAIEAIRKKIIDENFKVVKSKRFDIPVDTMKRFYEEHAHKFFYNRLVTFMTSGPSDVHILARTDAILHWRKVMGPTKVYKTVFTHPDSIRGVFGLTDTRNAAHGADSEESAAREITILFPDFSIEQWYQNDEPSFRNNNIVFACSEFEHLVL